ncbi:MAG: hypothetical protein HYV09_22540 [Deltaproteobacteria bacterium]|nr:hypothetical protein [Deltaproteobacteria bacterium]
MPAPADAGPSTAMQSGFATAATSAVAPTTALSTLATVRAAAPFAAVGRGVSLALHDGAFHVAAAPRTAWTARPSIDVAIGEAADAPTTLSIPGLPGVWIRITAPERRGRGTIVDGVVVYPDADAIAVADRERFEDLRVIRAETAPAAERFVVELGPALAMARESDGRIELLDRDGYVRFASEPAFAVDARGVKSALDVDVEQHERTVIVAARLARRDLAYPIVVDPAWSSVIAMKSKRTLHSATLLSNGKVLVAGGGDGVFHVSTTEVFDPATSTFSTGPNMAVTRWAHRGVALTTPTSVANKVLIFGPNGTTSELYDPVANTITTTGAFPYGQNEQPVAQLLPSGKVLAAGGSGGGWNANTALFDPTTLTWALQPTTAAMKYPAGFVRSVTLSTGKILKVGSYRGGAGWSFCELYDPATNTWTETGAMKDERTGHPVMLLPSGKVLTVGSYRHLDGARRAEIYDPAIGTWSDAALTRSGREGAEGATLPNGRAIVVGTQFNGDSRSSEVYDPATDTWSSASNMTVAREGGHTMTPLGTTGKFLVAGGGNGTGVISSAEIFQLLANGAACSATTPGDCASGFCVDGVCCNAACSGSCQACDLAGAVGTCGSVASGAPHGARSCAPYGVCVAGACKTTCTSTSDCNATSYCVSGACVPRLARGNACSAATDCASGFCVDGVCCDSACAGQCQACSLTGKLGTCSPVVGLPIPPRAACTGVDPGGTCGVQCNGVDVTKCNYPGKSTPCSGNSCKDGVETHASLCDGAGKCSDVNKACGAYLCGAAACKSSCAGAADCAAGYRCNAGVCVVTEGLGEGCAAAAECATGFCVDGVCCGSASCAAGSSCAHPGKKGTCWKSKGTSCGTDAECASGFCVDGVCCESKCDGQCQACDVSGSVGTCLAIAGAPHGARAKCDDGKGEVCAARACDGKDVAACAGWASGPSVSCKPATCASGKVVPEAKCDGAGGCVAGEPIACAPYACAGSACVSSCTTFRDCAPGNTCTAGACVPGASCSDDRLSSIARDGAEIPCGAYLCNPTTGECRTTCADSRECAGGYACDPTAGRCVAPSAGSEDDGGGCSVHRAAAAGSFRWMAIAALGVAFAMRRARARLAPRRAAR